MKKRKPESRVSVILYFIFNVFYLFPFAYYTYKLVLYLIYKFI